MGMCEDPEKCPECIAARAKLNVPVAQTRALQPGETQSADVLDYIKRQQAGVKNFMSHVDALINKARRVRREQWFDEKRHPKLTKMMPEHIVVDDPYDNLIATKDVPRDMIIGIDPARGKDQTAIVIRNNA